MPQIITVTMNPALDKSTRAEQVSADQKLSCQPPTFDPGGGGINVSRAIGGMGGESTAFYLRGGASGQKLQALLDAEGIDHRPIDIEGTTRENLMVFEESSGQQYRFNMPGPTVSEAEWRQMLDTVRTLQTKPDYVVASGSLPSGVPTDFYAQLADTVTEFGARFIVDTKREPLQAAVRQGVYLIKPNMRELGMLAGRPIESEAEQEEVATELVENGRSQVVVVSLGAGGVLLVTKEGCERIRTPTVPIKSKVGAGDSTVAGIVLALARNQPLHDAVRFGVAAGAAAVMTEGTQLCRRADVERLYERIQGNDQ